MMIDRPIKLTPLYTATQQLGAKFIELADWRFPEFYSTVDNELAVVRAGCGVADVTPHGKIQIEGEHAFEAIQAAFGVAPEATGNHSQVEFGHIYRLRRDLFYLSTPPGREREAQECLLTVLAQSNEFVTVTDLTHGLADIRVIGPPSTNIMSKLCGLDFHPAAFPNLTATQSSLAKTRQLIIRRDLGGLPTYSIIGARSLGAYVWDAILTAGREFAIIPVGVGALRTLEGS
jgi:heterotetrameric sarcosine oxidase gamma subunit